MSIYTQYTDVGYLDPHSYKSCERTCIDFLLPLSDRDLRACTKLTLVRQRYENAASVSVPSSDSSFGLFIRSAICESGTQRRKKEC